MPIDKPVTTSTMKGKDNCALIALTIIAQFHGIAVNPEDIAHQYFEHNTFSIQQWLLAAKNLGLKAKLSKQKIERLPFIALPAVVWREDGQHFLLAKIDGDRYLI